MKNTTNTKSVSEISRYCHETGKTVFLSFDGKDEIAVMSIDSYNDLIENNEFLSDKLELYAHITAGLNDVKAGRTKEFHSAMEDVMKRVWLNDHAITH